MDGRSGTNDRYRKASPWPAFVAIGLALSEVGVFLDLVALAVGGLLLLAGSCAGVLSETGYVETPWPLLAGMGGVLSVLGGSLYLLSPTGDGAIDLGFRAIAIGVAGAICLVGAFVGRLWGAGRPTT